MRAQHTPVFKLGYSMEGVGDFEDFRPAEATRRIAPLE